MIDKRRKYSDEQIEMWRRVWDKQKTTGASNASVAKHLGVCKYAFLYHTNPERRKSISRLMYTRFKRVKNEQWYKEQQRVYVKRYQARFRLEEPEKFKEKQRLAARKMRDKLKQDPVKWRKYLDYVAGKGGVDK